MGIFSFICRHCGPSEHPCEHALELIELQLLREFKTQYDQDQKDLKNRIKFIDHELIEIIHLLHRPQSATLTVLYNIPSVVGEPMPKTVAPGGTGQAVFHEWSGPAGTGTEVPLEGAVTFASDNEAVATVDPATGAITSVGPEGAANISGVDAKNSLTASDVFTVQVPPPPPPPAVSATMEIQ